MDFFDGYGFKKSDIRHITASDVTELCEKGAYILDVRKEYEVVQKVMDVPQCEYIPYDELADRYQSLSKDQAYILVDSVGLRSKDMLQFLLKEGFTKIAHLAGGIVNWERSGYPTRVDKSEQMSGGCMCQLRPNKIRTKLVKE